MSETPIFDDLAAVHPELDFRKLEFVELRGWGGHLIRSYIRPEWVEKHQENGEITMEDDQPKTVEINESAGFDFMAPLPDLHGKTPRAAWESDPKDSWEPAARHYRDIVGQ